MQAVFRILYSEIRGLHQSAYILAAFAFASQVLGLVRDRLLAGHFGAGSELDLYYAAFRIPDILFVLFASVLSVYVLVPFVSERTEKGDAEDARSLLSQVLTFFFVAYMSAAVLVFIFAENLVSYLYPGFSDATIAEVVRYARILLLQPFFLGISGLLSVVTQMRERFLLYACTPLLYNAGIIGGIIFLQPYYGMEGVVYGVVIGALLHMVIQIPFVMQSGLMPRITMGWDMRLMATVLTRSLPRALTLSMQQLVLLAFIGIASLMTAGSIATFQFALNLQSVPLAIVGVSYSVAAFPVLSHLFAKGDHAGFVMRVEAALRHILFWMVPVAALIIVVRAQIVRVLLGSGAFDWNDTRLTAAAFALFALSLAAQAVILLMVRAFYAGGDTHTPFRAALVSACATLGVSLLLYVCFFTVPSFAHIVTALLRLEGVSGVEMVTLPLGFSLVQIGQAIWLVLLFARRHGLTFVRVRITLVHTLLAALGGAFVSYIVLNMVASGIRSETFTGIFLQGFLSGVAGLGTITALLYLMKNDELFELWGAARRWPLMVRLLGPQEVDQLVL